MIKRYIAVLFVTATAFAQPSYDLQAEVNRTDTPLTRIVNVPAGTHTLEKTLQVGSNTSIVCEPGAIIAAADGKFLAATDVPEASLINIAGVTEVEIKGCLIRGPKAAEVPGSEFRHALRVTGSKRVRIDGVTVEGSGGDGLYIGPLVTTTRAPCEDVTVTNSKFLSNYRQGISIVSCVGCRVSDCEMSLTKGRAPQSGIDLEPSAVTDRMAGIVVERCVAKGNGGSAFFVNLDRQTTASQPVSITFEDCIGLEIPNGHYLIRVSEFGSNQASVKPKGFVRWGSSVWENK